MDKVITEKQKIGKYLTDMKELPPEYAVTEMPSEKKTINTKTSVRPVQNKSMSKTAKTVELEQEKADFKAPASFSVKDVILGIINFVTIILLIYLLTKLPQKSKELQAEKILEIKTQVNPAQQYVNLDTDKSKSDKLTALFLDQSGVVDFVGDVDKLKISNSTIRKVTFASQVAVKDRLGLYGLPIIIELRGSWQDIAPDLAKIQALPYLFRPVNVEAIPLKDDPNVILFNYGGILYVNDELGKTR